MSEKPKPRAPRPRAPRRMSKISRALTQSGLRPDRRFAQNFLINQGALESIVAASGASERTAVVEIGAGLGNLTDLLGQVAGMVTAVELDRNFQPIHQKHFADAENVCFAYGDIIELPLAGLWPSGTWDERVVVGNIPYNITSRILIKLLEERADLDRAYILMQREVAQRLVARPGVKRYSVLTAKLRCGFDLEIKLRITRRSFQPPPRVDSALVELRPCAQPLAVDPAERAEFFAMLDGAFGQRRKMLPNALGGTSSGAWPRDGVAAVLSRIGMEPTVRAEQMDSERLLEAFRALRAELGPAVFHGSR
jgi:16S rRNA (adenine1518-N6/adenine1519-N6)-dimethyltransferase